MPSGSPVNNSVSMTKGSSLLSLQERLKDSEKIYKSSEINNSKGRTNEVGLQQQKGRVRSCDDVSAAMPVLSRRASSLISNPTASYDQALYVKKRRDSEYVAMLRKKHERQQSAGEFDSVMAHRALHRKSLSTDDIKRVLPEPPSGPPLHLSQQSQQWVPGSDHHMSSSEREVTRSIVDGIVVSEPERRRLAPIGEEVKGSASALYLMKQQQQQQKQQQQQPLVDGSRIYSHSNGLTKDMKQQQQLWQKQLKKLSGRSEQVAERKSAVDGRIRFDVTADPAVRSTTIQAAMQADAADSFTSNQNLLKTSAIDKESGIRKSASTISNLNNHSGLLNHRSQLDSSHSVSLPLTTTRRSCLIGEGDVTSDKSRSSLDIAARRNDANSINSTENTLGNFTGLHARSSLDNQPGLANENYSALNTSLQTAGNDPGGNAALEIDSYRITNGLISRRTSVGGGIILSNLQSYIRNEAASVTGSSNTAGGSNSSTLHESSTSSKTMPTSQSTGLLSTSIISSNYVSSTGATYQNDQAANKETVDNYGNHALPSSLNLNAITSHPSSFTDAEKGKDVQGSSTSLRCLEAGSTTGKALMEEFERKRIAYKMAEDAIKERKIFTVMGPYPTLRDSLRSRGWIEKFASPDRTPLLRNLTCNAASRSAGSIRDGRSKPTLDMGMYTMLSNIVRNVTPTLLFAVRAVDVSSKVTKPSQVVNHFARASNFTTKVGLCRNLKSVPWYDSTDPSTFYPRCYSIESVVEKSAFIEDYRLMACMGFLKHFIAQEALPSTGTSDYQESRGANNNNRPTLSRRSQSESDAVIHRNSTNAVLTEIQNLSGVQSNRMYKSYFKNTPSNLSENLNQSQSSREHSVSGSWAAGDGDHTHIQNGGQINNKHLSAISETKKLSTTNPSEISSQETVLPHIRTENADNVNDGVGNNTHKKKGKWLSVKALYLAMKQCATYLLQQKHDDIDKTDNKEKLSDDVWDQFIYAYHQFVSDELPLDRKAVKEFEACRKLVKDLERVWPQFSLDGDRNVWIIKPAAKSRGRGIQCESQLNSILEASKISDCPLVAQKYIERPMLIYNTKFDIRQWFLVTDWNPLTMWFYKDCYLRFCSNQYSLKSFDPSIHLSNYSVQKYYKPSANRSFKLPTDNMWTSDEFVEYLRQEGDDDIWYEMIIPGMKRAIVCTLLCTQEQVEHRKGSFELFGADFMLTEDLRPWLLEINSSPSMARDTRATSTLVASVLEDTVKVVLDRQDDPTCDTGRFELAYCQPHQFTEPKSLESLPKISGKKVKGRNNNARVT